MKLFFFVVIMYVILMFGSFAVFMIMHENQHKQVFNEYGINSTIEYEFMYISGKTIPNDYHLTEERLISMRNKHIDVEIVGYNFVVLLFMIFMFNFIYVILIITLMKEKRDVK